MLYSINFLRFFASFFVVLSHIAHKGDQYSINSLEWYNFQGFGVDLFFILSGFMMCYTTYNRNTNVIFFLKNRFERLLPLYWLFTLLALLAFIINPALVNSSGGKTEILKSFFLIPNEHKYLIQNAWTLSYEFYFYFLFSLFLVLNINDKLKYFLILSFLSILSLIGILFNFHSYLLDFLFSNILFEFSLGILSFFILRKLSVSISVLFTLLGLFFLIYQNFYGAFDSIFGRALNRGFPVFLFFNGIVNLEYYFKNTQLRFLKFIERIGVSSYSLFLSHPFTLSLSAKILNKFHLKNSFTFTILLLFSSLIVGYFVYFLIEKRISLYFKERRLKSRLSRYY